MRKLAGFTLLFLLLAAPADDKLTFGRFGEVVLYRASPHPRRVVLFLSGDGGWNRGVVDMARILASMDALVVGIDLPRFMRRVEATKEACSYPAADLELLSKTVQRKLGFESYVPPVLVGYSSGATLAYAVLAQAPPGTFRGAISLGFCPDLPFARPFCRGQGLTSEPGPKGKGLVFQPARSLGAPWIAFQGEADQVCDKSLSIRYTSQIPGAEVVLLPQVGHGFSVQSHWVPQFRSSFLRLTEEKDPAAARPEPLKDLPVVEVPARTPGGDTLAVFVSGDGGWAGLDREIAGALAEEGVAVAGLDSLHYFWTARTPDGAARDLERILRHYLAAWKRERVLLVGYSFGAEVLPFLASRLPADLLGRVRQVALIGPGPSATFELHLTDWLGSGGEAGLPVLPEVRKLAGRPLLCIYGTDEDDSLCPQIKPPLGQAVELSGGHHLGGNYGKVAGLILRGAPAGNGG